MCEFFRYFLILDRAIRKVPQIIYIYAFVYVYKWSGTQFRKQSGIVFDPIKTQSKFLIKIFDLTIYIYITSLENSLSDWLWRFVCVKQRLKSAKGLPKRFFINKHFKTFFSPIRAGMYAIGKNIKSLKKNWKNKNNVSGNVCCLLGLTVCTSKGSDQKHCFSNIRSRCYIYA